MKSVWAEEPLLTFPPLRSHVKTDVLIIGGGMAGLLCGYRLQKNGVSCVIAEAAEIAGGTTGNTTAKVTTMICRISVISPAKCLPNNPKNKANRL